MLNSNKPNTKYDPILFKIVCSLLSAEDRSNIILEVLRSNHKEQGKFKDNMIKQQLG